VERRGFLAWALAAGAVSLEGLTPRQLLAVGREAHDNAGTLRALSPSAAATVRAAAERILPRTDTPGATDANVTAFIDSMLDGWYSAEQKAAFLSGVAERAASPAAVPWYGMLRYLTVYGYCTSKVGATDGLHNWPQPFRYEPCTSLPKQEGS
jgi:glucoside 3-dehydrogenase (cytochrome c) hitch-hiker subunit